MAIETIDALVMRSYALRDTSRIVHLFTAERGHIKVVAKGARSPGSRFGSALEPFTRASAVIYYKIGRDLQLLSQADIITPRRVLGRSLVRYAYATAVLELLDQLLGGEESNPPLFALLDATLSRLETRPDAELRSEFMSYVIRLLEVMGFRPELHSCVVCNQPLDGAVLFDANRGGAIHRKCSATMSATTPLSESALAALRRFASDAPGDGAPAAVADEVARALDAFLRVHVPRYRRPRALELVRATASPD